VTSISAKDVAELRKVTGAGMMDCKRALEENEGEMERAKTWLREKGLAAAAKRAGRAAAEGAVEVIVDGNVGVVVELTCETDFVAKGDVFGDFLNALAQHVLQAGDGEVGGQSFGDGTVDDAVKELGSKVGENVGLGRVVRFESPDGIVDGYKHIQSDRGVIGVVVELGGVDAGDVAARELAHELALHVASAAPRWLRTEDVPEEVVAAEREVLANLTRNEGKPENAIPKIVEGRIGGFFKENVLLEQGFVREPKRTVASILEAAGGRDLRRFARVRVGDE
jgi:elongation factor Ts